MGYTLGDEFVRYGFRKNEPWLLNSVPSERSNSIASATHPTKWVPGATVPSAIITHTDAVHGEQGYPLKDWRTR